MENPLSIPAIEHTLSTLPLDARVKRLVLFGSHAKGSAQEHSDLEVAQAIAGQFPDTDVQVLERVSARYRSIGALPYKTLGKKTYYSEEDVLTFLSNHIKDFKKEDIAFYKARIHNFFHK